MAFSVYIILSQNIYETFLFYRSKYFVENGRICVITCAEHESSLYFSFINFLLILKTDTYNMTIFQNNWLYSVFQIIRNKNGEKYFVHLFGNNG